MINTLTRNGTSEQLRGRIEALRQFAIPGTPRYCPYIVETIRDVEAELQSASRDSVRICSAWLAHAEQIARSM